MDKSAYLLDYKLKSIRWRNKGVQWAWKLFRAILLAGICFVILYPILLKIAVSIKSQTDLYDPTIILIPRHFTWDNVRAAVHVMNYGVTLRNTLIVSGLTMLLQTISCALAGYGFARFEFRGRSVLFALVILTILVPTQTMIVPMYLQFRHFDVFGLIGLLTGKDGISLINTFWPSAITALTANGLKSGLYIYIFRQFFRGVPKEIEEASLIDGAGGFRTFFAIMLPNAIPPIVTVMLFSFVWQWNDTFYSSMFMGQIDLISNKVTTLASGIGTYLAGIYGVNDTSYRPDPNYVSMIVDTGVLVSIAPLILLYLFVQRFFVESVERTGVVG
ncbi:carbohydrate ABC transporter permease [Cohnella sp. 56]|uniref:carbohydrate ABC transporter permease n=1 Tax=Cohnella sp. 56 TaxID=3113722 RepID=UPI0030E7B67C